MNKLWLVAKEVFKKHVKSWAFFWMVAGPFIMGLVILAIGYFIYLDQSSSSVGSVAVLSDNPTIVQRIKELEDENNYRFDLNQDQANKELLDNRIDGYLWVSDQENLDAKFYRNNSGKNISTGRLQDVLTDYQLQVEAGKLDLDSDSIEKLRQSNVQIETISVQSDESGEVTEVSEDDPEKMAKVAMAYIVCFLVFMFIMNYVSIVSQEIATEKGSRIMEIVLSSISATDHFLGKLLGVGLVIVAHLVVTFIVGAIVSYIAGLFLTQSLFNSPESLQTIQESAQTANSFDPSVLMSYIDAAQSVIWYGLLFAFLGVAIYSIIASFIGSLVSKMEDVNKMIAPITLLGVAGFYIALYALSSPNSPIVRIGSFFPLFTPFIMPFRIANDTVSGGELGLALAIVIVFLIIAVYISILFYKSNVLVYSDKGLIGAFKKSWANWQNERKK